MVDRRSGCSVFFIHSGIRTIYNSRNIGLDRHCNKYRIDNIRNKENKARRKGEVKKRVKKLAYSFPPCSSMTTKVTVDVMPGIFLILFVIV